MRPIALVTVPMPCPPPLSSSDSATKSQNRLGPDLTLVRDETLIVAGGAGRVPQLPRPLVHPTATSDAG